MATIPHTYDGVLSRHAREIPLAYLRALAWGESRMNPRSRVDPDSPNSATGLLQVVGVVRRDYNERHGTDYEPDDLFDVELNVRMAVGTMERILVTYRRHRALTPDWDSRRWVELFTLGWNAGYSDAAGVGYVVGVLEDEGVATSAITIERVQERAATLPRASRWLQRDLAWHRRVTTWYYDEREKRGGGGAALLALALIVAAGAA